MVIFLILLILMFILGVRLYRRGDDDFSRGLGIGLAACMVTLCVNNMFGDRWTYMEVSSNLWLFAGMAARLLKISLDKERETAHG